MGLHTCPLPHIFVMALCLSSGDFGGGTVGTSPFLLTTPVSTSEAEEQALLLTVGVYFLHTAEENDEFVYVHT